MAKLKHLTEYHKKAMELKYKGVLYRDIAENLAEEFRKSAVNRKFTNQTIKNWFREDGPLAEAYCLYEAEMDGIHQEMMNIARKAGVRIREENFRLANEMLVALMGSSNDSIKLAAIKELLDRVEGKARDIITLEQKSDSLLGLSYEQRLEKIRQEYGGQDQSNKTKK